MPVSKQARAVVELGATQTIEVVGLVADDLVRSGRTSYAAIAGVLAQLARPGKPGIGTVAQVLDERGDGFVSPYSDLERLLFSVLEAGGLPAPARLIALSGRGPRSEAPTSELPSLMRISSAVFCLTH